MRKYLPDTNIVSEILRENKTVMENFLSELDNNSPIYICSIVYYEIERGSIAGGKFRLLKNFYDIYEKLPHLFLDRDNFETIQKASEIYVQLRKGKNISDNDIYIAAIAQVNDCILVTDNVKHFERIDGLQIINWKEKIL